MELSARSPPLSTFCAATELQVLKRAEFITTHATAACRDAGLHHPSVLQATCTADDPCAQNPACLGCCCSSGSRRKGRRSSRHDRTPSRGTQRPRADAVAPRSPRPRRQPAATRRGACLVQIDSDGSRQQIECTDGSAEYLRDRNDGAAGSLRDRAYALPQGETCGGSSYRSGQRGMCIVYTMALRPTTPERHRKCFGVQAMVMAVGLRDARAVAAGGGGGAAAAVDWVLKDALGKVTRLGWAAHGPRV